MFQHVLFYVLSNDLVASKKLLLTAENARFQIVFPGDYGATSIGNTNLKPLWYILLMHNICDYADMNGGRFIEIFAFQART